MVPNFWRHLRDRSRPRLHERRQANTWDDFKQHEQHLAACRAGRPHARDRFLVAEIIGGHGLNSGQLAFGVVRVIRLTTLCILVCDRTHS